MRIQEESPYVAITIEPTRAAPMQKVVEDISRFAYLHCLPNVSPIPTSIALENKRVSNNSWSIRLRRIDWWLFREGRKSTKTLFRPSLTTTDDIYIAQVPDMIVTNLILVLSNNDHDCFGPSPNAIGKALNLDSQKDYSATRFNRRTRHQWSLSILSESRSAI